MKKGEIALANIEKYVMMLVAIVVLSTIMIFYGSRLDTYVDHQTCKDSVISNSMLRVKGFGVTDLASRITCPTREQKISLGDTKNAQRVIAQEMYFCYDQFLRGEQELFDKEGLYCHPCAYIAFSERDKTLSISDYLLTQRAPAPHQHLTYSEYLEGRKEGATEEILELNQQELFAAYTKEVEALPEELQKTLPKHLDQELDSNKQYAVLFWYAKGDTFTKEMFRSVGLLPMVAGAGVIGGIGGAAVGLGTAAVVIKVAAAGLAVFGAALSWPVTLTIVAAGAIVGFGTGGTASMATVIDAAPGTEDTATASLVILAEWSDEALAKAGCTNFAAKQR